MDQLPKTRATGTGVGILNRPTIGAASNVYLVDGEAYYIGLDGKVTKWQAYVKNAGKIAFQVWRRTGTVADRRHVYNKVTPTNQKYMHIPTRLQCWSEM